MTEQELRELIESTTNDAWYRNDLLPNIQARLFYKLKQALRIHDVVGRSEQLICLHCNKYKRMQGNGMMHQLCECGE